MILECNKKEKKKKLSLYSLCGLFYEAVVSLLGGGGGGNLNNSQFAIVSSPALYVFSILFSLQL